MGLSRDTHEIYQRKLSKNMAVGVILLAVVGLIFAVTIVKISNGSMMEGFDHQYRASQLPVTEAPE